MKEIYFTTGSYATGSVKAALIFLLRGEKSLFIEIKIPNNKKVNIPIKSVKKIGDKACCSVIKISVESADVTHNMEINAIVSLRNDRQIIIEGGQGIGKITKPGLSLPVGEAAINPVPRKMIHQAIREITEKGVNVLISAPKGEKIAQKTTNARIGILCGISIIGTKGIMIPKSLDSYKKSITQQINFCVNNSIKEVILVPGNISEHAVLREFNDRVKEEQIIQCGDFLGFALKLIFSKKMPFMLAGHPGKLAKVLTGHFQTHYTKSPRANEAVVKLLDAHLDKILINKISEIPTVEGIIEILKNSNNLKLLNIIANTISEKIESFLNTDIRPPVLLFNMAGELSGHSEEGERWIRR